MPMLGGGTQRAKSRGFCVESPGMADTWWRGIHVEIWVVSESRIHVEIEGKFPHGFLRDFPEIPCAEFIGISGGFIGGKKSRILI